MLVPAEVFRRPLVLQSGSVLDMPDLPERTPYFRANEHFTSYFKEVHASGALDAKTKSSSILHLSLRSTANLERCHTSQVRRGWVRLRRKSTRSFNSRAPLAQG
jgi:hypothetical protein